MQEKGRTEDNIQTIEGGIGARNSAYRILLQVAFKQITKYNKKIEIRHYQIELAFPIQNKNYYSF